MKKSQTITSDSGSRDGDGRTRSTDSDGAGGRGPNAKLRGTSQRGTSGGSSFYRNLRLPFRRAG